MIDVRWFSVSISLHGSDIREGNTEIVKGLEEMAWNLRKKNHSSTLWYRVESVKSWDLIQYEILIPDLTERQVLILKDLDYKVKELIGLNRQKRKEDFIRLSKPKK